MSSNDVETKQEHEQVKEHWDETWDEHDAVEIEASAFPYDQNKTHDFFAERVHELPKSNVLEIGCGRGQIAVHLAKRGADVTAVDVSAKAVDAARRNAEYNGVGDKVSVQQMDAMELDTLSQTFDFVVGRFVLHHIEPFSEFVDVLNSITTPSARGVFLENSAQNRLLILCRDYLAGRFGIPKYGDDHEHPLTQQEIRDLREEFSVDVHRPELVFFKKMNTYFIGYDNGLENVVDLVKSIDDTLYKVAPPLRKYSYLQVVELDK